VRISLYTTVIGLHNTTQDSYDNFHSYPPDNHHSSDDVYWRGTATLTFVCRLQNDITCYMLATQNMQILQIN